MNFYKVPVFLALFAALTFGVTAEVRAHPPVEHTPIEQEVEETVLPEPDVVEPDMLDGHSHEGDASHDHDAVMPVHDDAPQADHHEAPADAHVDDDGHHDDAASPVSGHAHWGENGPQSGLEKAFASLGVFHALFVHFPIALMMAAALAQAMRLVSGTASLDQTVRFLVWTAALGGLAAGIFGWAHSGPPASDEQGVMLVHRWLGTSLTIGLLLTALAVEWKQTSNSSLSKLVMNIAIFAGAASVAVNGFLGGALAHGGVRHLMGGG